jgi:hypothetical protein
MKHRRKLSLFSLMFILGVNLFAQSGNTITISGQVTDFEGNSIDSSVVILMHRDFSTAYETYSNEMGYYILDNVEKGQYMAMYAMRLKEYPRSNAVSEENMRLEFWAWNVIADKDLTINPRYHRLELYGFQIFEVMGGAPYLMAYVRPMSLGKYLAYEKDIYLNKEKAEKVADISAEPENIEFKIYAGNEPLTIHSVQPLIEYGGEDNQGIRNFFLQFDRPKEFSAGDYCIFRIEATHNHNVFGVEKGENLYFYELKRYK